MGSFPKQVGHNIYGQQGPVSGPPVMADRGPFLGAPGCSPWVLYGAVSEPVRGLLCRKGRAEKMLSGMELITCASAI